MSLDPAVVLDYWPLFLEGALMTLRITITAFFAGLTIGAVAAMTCLPDFGPF